MARQAEEVVLLLDLVGHGAVDRAEAAVELALGVELLAADAVQAAVGALVDVAGAVARSPEAPDAGTVAFFGAGADEVVERQVQRRAQAEEQPGVARHEVGRRHAFALGGLDVLEAVLVGAGQEPDIVAPQPPVARERVGDDVLERMADMRLGVDVRDGRGDEPRRGSRAALGCGHGGKYIGSRAGVPITARRRRSSRRSGRRRAQARRHRRRR